MQWLREDSAPSDTTSRYGCPITVKVDFGEAVRQVNAVPALPGESYLIYSVS